MKNLQLFIIAVILSFSYNCFATIIFVPADYTTIQAAIDAANNGDIIVVSDGTYTGAGNINIDLNGKEIIVKSQNGPLTCIIDLQDSTVSAFEIDSGNANTIVDGFKVINGANVGIHVYTSDPIIQNCIVTNCFMGIYSEGHWSGAPGASPIIRNNLVYSNTGDGLQTYESGSPIVINNTIVSNGTYGILSGFCSSIFKNNIITGNGTGIKIDTGAIVAINTYNDVWNNTTNYDLATAGTGDISVDPMLDGTYHLSAGSPCIDAGDPITPKDPDSTVADMGAYYYPQSVGVVPTLSTLPVEDIALFPNPFYSNATVTFSVAQKSNVTISIFSVDGRTIATLCDQNYEPGTYQLSWDGTNEIGNKMETGIYFCNIKTELFVHTKQVVYLK